MPIPDPDDLLAEHFRVERFTVDPDHLLPPATTTVSWRVTSDGEVQAGLELDVAPGPAIAIGREGSRTFAPQTTTTYRLVAVAPGRRETLASARVQVCEQIELSRHGIRVSEHGVRGLRERMDALVDRRNVLDPGDGTRLRSRLRRRRADVVELNALTLDLRMRLFIEIRAPREPGIDLELRVRLAVEDDRLLMTVTSFELTAEPISAVTAFGVAPRIAYQAFLDHDLARYRAGVRRYFEAQLAELGIELRNRFIDDPREWQLDRVSALRENVVMLQQCPRGRWTQIAGAARDIGVGPDGAIWIVGTQAMAGGFGVMRFAVSGWEAFERGATRIAVGPFGPWIVDDAHRVWRLVGGAWTRLAGEARDIGVGPDDEAWMIGTDFTPHRWNGTDWVPVPGNARRVAVGPSGVPWVADADGRLFTHDGTQWNLMDRRGRDVGVGANGAVWVVERIAAGSRIFRRIDADHWIRTDGAGRVIAVGPDGAPWIVDEESAIFRRIYPD